MGVWGVIKAIGTLGGSVELAYAEEDYRPLYDKHERLRCMANGTRLECKTQLSALGRDTQRGIKLLRKSQKMLERFSRSQQYAGSDFAQNSPPRDLRSLPLISQVRSDFTTSLALAKGTGASVAIAAGSWALVSVLGTASTGTAIASLSGAAATNAIMAWFGGGALAAGGAGMAGGALVLGALAIVPLVAISAYSTHKKADQLREASRELERKHLPAIKSAKREAELILESLQDARNRVTPLITSLRRAYKHATKAAFPFGWLGRIWATLRIILGLAPYPLSAAGAFHRLDQAAFALAEALQKEPDPPADSGVGTICPRCGQRHSNYREFDDYRICRLCGSSHNR